MTKSRVLQKLRAGEIIKIASVSRVTDPWMTEVIGKIGFDAVWLDMEHRPLGFNVIDPMSLACRATGMDLVVRILKTGYDSPMRVLECGANGLIVPHCRSVAEAERWVEWAKFPPLGKRGFDGVGADGDFMLAPALEQIRNGNEETFLALQIEDKEALECVDDMIALDGVDFLFIGPGDLSLSLGVPFQFDHPLMCRAIDKVANAAEKAGKWWTLATGSPRAAQQAIDRGARLIVCGADHVVLVQGFQSIFEQYSQLNVRP